MNLYFFISTKFYQILFPTDIKSHFNANLRKWYTINDFITKICEILPYILSQAGFFINNYLIAPNNFWVKQSNNANIESINPNISLMGFFSGHIKSLNELSKGFLSKNINWNWEASYKTFNGQQMDWNNNLYDNYNQLIKDKITISYNATINLVNSILNPHIFN